jgi:hypothetical protein
MFQLTIAFRLIKHAGDRRQRMIGRVTLSQNFSLRVLLSRERAVARHDSFLSSDCG